MDTKLVNSQFLSRKDVQIWFWDGTRELTGEVRALADNGLILRVWITQGLPPGRLTAEDLLVSLSKDLRGKRLTAELSSQKVKGEVKLQIVDLDVASSSKQIFSMIATFTTPPEPDFLKRLMEPVVTPLNRTPKRF